MHEFMHVVVAYGRVVRQGKLPEVKGAHEDAHGHYGIGQAVIGVAHPASAHQRADATLEQPQGQSAQHGGKRGAQQHQQRTDHPDHKVLYLVDKEIMLGQGVYGRLQCQENDQQA